MHSWIVTGTDLNEMLSINKEKFAFFKFCFQNKFIFEIKSRESFG